MARGMHVAILGPVDIGLLRELHGAGSPPGAPLGNLGATPLATLVGALVRSGTAVTTVTTSDEAEQTSHEWLDDCSKLIVVPRRIDGGGRDFRRAERRAMSAVLSEIDADVVHAHWTYEYALGALTCRGCPVLVSVRDWAPAILRHNPHPYNVARLAVQLAVIARAKHLTANSPYIAERLRRLRQTPRLLPNPIAASRFVEASAKTSCDAPPTFVAINNGFKGHKNVPALINAFAVVRQQVPEARLVLIGKGHERGGAAHLWSREQGFDRDIEFLGHIAPVEIDRRLRNATAFVHPSLEESFGMVLVEAMAAGAPVIAGERSGAVPWVVGEAGVLCDVTDPLAIAEAMLKVVHSGELRADLAQRGQQNARERFHEDAVASTANGIYADLVRGSSGAV